MTRTRQKLNFCVINSIFLKKLKIFTDLILMSRLIKEDLVTRSLGKIKKIRNMSIVGNIHSWNATKRLLFPLIFCLNRNVYGRDYCKIAPKDQLLRKISGKRTVKIKTLESELRCSAEGWKISGTQTDEQTEF